MKMFLKRLIDFLDLVGKMDTVAASLSMFFIAAISVWGVVTRYILGNPAGWVEELSLGLFVWLTFFGMSILARRGELVSIEFLLDYFPGKLRFFMKRILATVLMTICLGIMIILGFGLTFFSFSKLTAVLRIPLGYIYAGIPLGSVFTLYHVLRHAVSGPRFCEKIDEDMII